MQSNSLYLLANKIDVFTDSSILQTKLTYSQIRQALGQQRGIAECITEI
jgi:hypothetical protein